MFSSPIEMLIKVQINFNGVTVACFLNWHCEFEIPEKHAWHFVFCCDY